MLEVHAIDAGYGDSIVLRAFSLAVPTGARIALIGRNGAGKSTLLKSIVNAGPRVRGRVAFEGAELGTMPTHQRARRGLCLVPEDRRILGHLSIWENLKMAAAGAAKPSGKADVEAVLQRFPTLAGIRDRKGGVLSGGQQQILAIARAALSQPRLLLLDEPTEGLAPLIVEGLVGDILSICDQAGCGLLLCEQNIWFSRQCTSEVRVIDSGAIVFAGTWDAFDAHPEIQARHLAI